LEEACRGADAIIILTEWSEYSEIQWPNIAALMRKPAWVFDARRVADENSMLAAKLKYWAIGAGH
jgi:UDPglucose 6-dehydrogenase